MSPESARACEQSSRTKTRPMEQTLSLTFRFHGPRSGAGQQEDQGWVYFLTRSEAGTYGDREGDLNYDLRKGVKILRLASNEPFPVVEGFNDED
jgi:hypothetical protein